MKRAAAGGCLRTCESQLGESTFAQNGFSLLALRLRAERSLHLLISNESLLLLLGTQL
jgi:hypothetical protein